jgi:hypothetical protein
MSESIYWESQPLLSRNAVFNYAVGGRGTGKTYNFKYTRIRHFIKTGKQFIYLRRYKSEFEDKDTFFNDVLDRFDGYEFRINGMKAQIRKAPKSDKDKVPWETCGYFVTLSNALTKKSVPYPNVDWIGFDEFIIDKGALHYLQKEVTAFLDFYNTVDRFQDRVRVLFMANAVSITNPYFLYYRLYPRKDKQFVTSKDGFHCIEYINSENFTQHVLNTRFGQMIKGTAYFNYAVSNEFQDDSNDFIEVKPKTAQYFVGLKFDGHLLGVWVDYANSIYYICKKVAKNKLVYTLTRDDFAPNMIMIEKSNQLIKSLKRLYMYGYVRFDSVQTRSIFNDVLKYLGV